MKEIKKILIFIFVVFTLQLKAQDFPYHYFTHIDPFVNNPSMAALNYKLTTNISSYNLWAGGFKPLNDFIISFAISPGFVKNEKNRYYDSRYALGTVYQHEVIGPTSFDVLQLIYAYHIPLTPSTLLSLGVNASAEHLAIDINSLHPLDGDDPRLLSGNDNSFLFDGGFGATVSGKDFKISFSAFNLAPGVFRFKNASAEEIPEYRKYFLTGNYKIRFSEVFYLQPEITLRNTRYNKPGFDLVSMFDLNLLLVGTGYRSESTIFIFVQVPLKDFVLTYTSENPLNSNHMIGNGHTFSLGWRF